MMIMHCMMRSTWVKKTRPLAGLCQVGAFSPEVLFFFPSDDLRAWQGGNQSESALLGRALITLD